MTKLSKCACGFSFVSFLIAGIVSSPVFSQNAILPEGDDGKVTRVVSGDTVEVKINDTGFTIGYLGIEAAKGSECYAKQAAAFNSRLVSGKVIRAERDTSDFDSQGRLMRWIWLSDGRLVNEELVRLGFARITQAGPDLKYRDRLLAAEKIARDANYGLWSACPELSTPVAVEAVPTSSSLSCPSKYVCITAPISGAVVASGSIVVFRGTADDPYFARYQFMLGNGSSWGHIADFERAVVNGALMGFQTGSVPPGTYTIRLQVIDKTGNTRFDKADVILTITPAAGSNLIPPPSEALPGTAAENGVNAGGGSSGGNGGSSCCKVCTTGQACGDTCISKRYTCHKSTGCACNG